MNIHWLQHVEFEGLGMISSWAQQNNHSLSCTRLFNDESLPDNENFDMLIIMGGPMSIHDVDLHPWLIAEKHFISRCVARQIPILGICLGAQLLAETLGAEVQPHRVKEIGWFPVERCAGVNQGTGEILPETLSVLHWHGDTFTLPPGSQQVYMSAACANQAFLHDKRFLGLQFHLEIAEDELSQLVQNCRHELVAGEWIQNETELLDGLINSKKCYEVLCQILNYLSTLKKERGL